MNEALHSMVDVLTSDTSRQAFQVTAVALPYLVVALLSAWGLKQVFGVVSFLSRGIWRGATVTGKGLYSTAMFVKRQRQKSLEKKIQKYLVAKEPSLNHEVYKKLSQDIETKLREKFQGGSPVTVAAYSPKIEVGKPAKLIANSGGAHSPVVTLSVAKVGEYIIPTEVSSLENRVYFRNATGNRNWVWLNEVVPA